MGPIFAALRNSDSTDSFSFSISFLINTGFCAGDRPPELELELELDPLAPGAGGAGGGAGQLPLPLLEFLISTELPGTVIVGTIFGGGIRKISSNTLFVKPSTIFCFIRLNGAFGCTEIPDIPLPLRTEFKMLHLQLQVVFHPILQVYFQANHPIKINLYYM